MKRLATLSDDALFQRIERLDTAERELEQGAMERVLEAELHGRPPKANPQHAGLLGALKAVREDMRRAEAELFRRDSYVTRQAA